MSDTSCEQCGSPRGLVKLTQVVNDKVTKHVLCEECAKKRGIHSPPDVAELSLPAALERIVEGEADRTRAEVECPYCALSFEELRDGGLLGCPQCYETFGDRLTTLFRRVHRAERHVGKVYLPPDATASDHERVVAGLRRRLERAVSAEDFERAAELRDRLRATEPA